jgi:hypothetical protein
MHTSAGLFQVGPLPVCSRTLATFHPHQAPRQANKAIIDRVIIAPGCSGH